jgi:hypothetical protein
MMALACMVISACTASPPVDASAGKVMVDGDAYLINQLTASTWTATAQAPSRQPGPLKPASHAALLGAIERVSGCKVTDSDYSRQGLQLDAQVDCGRGLNK